MKAILDFISNICPITGDSLVDTIHHKDEKH